ncbi:MAG TPA: non-heme iron oxygenase ferredoxin subunit [Bradyrhizobium sp.]|nr:non-heme iron oxygenase ferredoxin subunit [Bradyrhizobium sp.]
MSDPEGEWHVALAESEVSDGEPAACEIHGIALAICRVDGAYYATSNICTHEAAFLSDGLLEGCVLECPLHGAQFDLRTGEALSSPAEIDLETFPVRVAAGKVEVFVPSEK